MYRFYPGLVGWLISTTTTKRYLLFNPTVTVMVITEGRVLRHLALNSCSLRSLVVVFRRLNWSVSNLCPPRVSVGCPVKGSLCFLGFRISCRHDLASLSCALKCHDKGSLYFLAVSYRLT